MLGLRTEGLEPGKYWQAKKVEKNSHISKWIMEIRSLLTPAFQNSTRALQYQEELLSGFIPALYFGFPKRALRNHADCLQPLENYLASPKAEIILLRSAKKILAQGKALEEWRCSRKTVRKYLLRPVQLLVTNPPTSQELRV